MPPNPTTTKDVLEENTEGNVIRSMANPKHYIVWDIPMIIGEVSMFVNQEMT